MSLTPPRRPLDHLLVEAADIRTRRNRGPGGRVERIILVFADGTRESIEISDRIRAEARRSRMVVEEDERADGITLSVPERNLLQAVAESAEPVTGDEAARLAGYPPGSKARIALSALVKKRCLAKRGGYVATVLGRKVLGAPTGESEQQ
jgi:hypothetical protein